MLSRVNRSALLKNTLLTPVRPLLALFLWIRVELWPISLFSARICGVFHCSFTVLSRKLSILYLYANISLILLHSSMKYLTAFVSALIFSGTVLAAPIDVPSDAWYSATVSKFGRAGYFDETQPFRPAEKATRAEFVQLVVKLQGGVKHSPFTTQSFDDVSPNNPFFNYFEEAGLAGWLKGTGSCYGKHPCTANPNTPINRAEAATLMIRAFNLQMSDEAPTFSDNPSGQWFTLPINSAASLCVLQGDAGGKRVRPADNMIRAEMVTMLQRSLQNLRYPNCAAVGNFSLPKISESQSVSSVSIQSTSSSVSSVRSSESEEWVDPMKVNIDLWKTWHTDLVLAAKELSRQNQGSGCIKIYDELESTFIMRFNEYIAIYNDALLRSQQRTGGSRQQIEEAMVKWKLEFDAAPTICY